MTDVRLELFCRAHGAANRDSVQLGEALGAVTEAARAAWPNVTLDDAVWLPFLAERARDLDPLEACQTLRTADLYLACACIEGVPQALSAIEASVLPKALRAATQVSTDADFLDEVAQHVRERVLWRRPGEPSKLSNYQGMSSLVQWLRVVVLRAAFDLKRAAPVQVSVDEALVRSRDADLELDYVKAQYRDALRTALLESLAALPAKDRALLRLNFVEGLNIAAIGAVYGTHRATVARWIASARETLLRDLQARLGARLRLPDAEVAGVWQLVRSQLDASLRGALKD